MAERENVQIVEQVYAALGQRDMPAALNLLTGDIEWHIYGPSDTLPFTGTFRGHDGVVQLFKTFSETVEPEHLGSREFVAEGDKVVVFGSERTRVKSTGRFFEMDTVHLWTLREGKVVAFREYYDTAAVVAAFRGA